MSEPRTDGATRRKTWDRTGQAVNIKDTDVKSDSLAGKGVDPSYREYLAVLQEKNRILRELRKKEEKKKEALAQRERGFEVNFLGANEERIRKKQENDKGGGALRKDQRSNVRQRSAWQKGSIQIQTMRGSVIRLAPPSMEQTRESMQWLVSEEGRTWLETEQGQDWLQTEPDEDKDGRAEGSLVRDSLRILAATLKYNELSLEDGFDQFDLDNDGRIHLEDWMSVIESINMDLSEEASHALFQFLDRDGDGFIEALDWVEVLHDIDTSEELRARGIELSAQEKERKKAITSPVGRYIRTGEMPKPIRSSRDQSLRAAGKQGLHTVSEFQSADSDEDLYSEDVDRGDMMEEEGENADVEEEQYEDDFASDDDAVNIFSQGSDGESKGELPHARVKNEDEISEESFEDDEECSSPAALEKTIEEIESDGSLHDEFEAAVDEAEKVWSQPSSTKTMSAQESNARIIRSALPPMSSASSSSLLPRRATSARDVKEGAESSSSANAVNKDKKELDAILAALARENEEVASTPKASQGSNDDPSSRLKSRPLSGISFPKIPKTSSRVEQEFAKDNFIGISKSQDNTGAATGSSEKKLFQREVVATTERSPDPMKAVSSVLAKETRQIPAVALDSGDAKYKSGLSPPPSSSQHQLAQEDDEKLKHDNELVVHVLSNWGNKKVVGLTEIELFDETGSKVRIANAQVSTFGFKSSTDRSNRLINGCKLTTNDADMWSAYLSEEGEGGQIVFVLPAQVCIGAVRLWNYNKSMLDSDKGVRRVKIVENGRKRWEGEVRQACGSITSDFSTTVELIDGIKLPVVTFEEETKLVVQPVQDVRLRDVEEGEPIWLTGKDSKQSSSDQLLPSLPSADVMGEIPLLTETKETFSWSRPRFGRRARETDVQQSLESLSLFGTQHLGRIGNSTDFGEKLKTQEEVEEKVSAKNEEMKEEEASYKQPPTQVPAKSSSSVENRRRGEEDSQQDALSLVMRESARKVPAKIISVAEEKAREETSMLEPPIYSIPTQPKDRVPPTCVIPQTPAGRLLELRILSTWGDDHYVGLSGIEIFDGRGQLLAFQDPTANIRAEPADINCLPGYHSDPRTVDNLLDGVNGTCDDLHQWLAPFKAGEANLIFIDLEETTTVSMVRVWNYNKSRIHAARGARQVELYLDSTMLFMGEIRPAPGNLADAEEHAEILLFTQDPNLLHAIATSMDNQRELIGQLNDDDEKPEDKKEEEEPTERPSTPGDDQQKMSMEEEQTELRPEASRTAASGRNMSALVTQIAISILDTWGDSCYAGLTGIEIISENGEKIALKDDQIFANPRDLNDIPGSHADPRTKDKLIDGHNVTSDDHHMWLIPFTPGASHLLQFDLLAPTSVAAVRLWNYNKSAEDATRGAKRVLLMLDGRLVSPDCGFVLRKAPGHAMFDFGQTITMEEALTQTRWSLPRSLNESPKSLAQSLARLHPMCDAPCLPRGLTVSFVLAASHGDLYYIGLNGIKLFDELGNEINLQPKQIVAVPGSINELPEVRERGGGDCRTPDKLVDGVNDTWDAQHLWLAPLAKEGTNRIFVLFDAPVTLSMIQIWNYSRTPSRGVSEVHVAVDGLYVHMGYLRPAPDADRRDLGKSFVQSIMLGPCEEGNVDRESIAAPQAEQHVVLVNERKVVGGAQILQQEKSSQPSAFQQQAPSSSAPTESFRPSTSVPVRGGR